MPWYKFTPCCNNEGNPKDPNQYTLWGNGTQPTSPNCTGYKKICAIQALDWRGRPIIDCDLEHEIWCAQERQRPSANVLLKGTDCDDCDDC